MPEELPCSSYTSKLKMLKKQGKKTFGLGLSNLISQRTIYKDKRGKISQEAPAVVQERGDSDLFQIGGLYQGSDNWD